MKASMGSGSTKAAPSLLDQAPSESAFSGSEMSVAASGERNFMPLGMLRRQNDIGSPNTCVATPRDFRWAATARPYGPAPITTTSGPVLSIDRAIMTALAAEIGNSGVE